MIQVRRLATIEEFSAALQLQQCVWGFADAELVPLPVFVVASQAGGQVLGAFDGSRMIGFCLAFPALKPGGQPYLHSHMLAVLPEYRNAGVGRQLKLEQRSDALARGLDLMEWTFDPLQIKNAYFNIARLGAIVRQYLENEYGNTSSPLDGGLPTDRCVAQWWLASPRVQETLGHTVPSRDSALTRARLGVEERIVLPSDMDRIRREDPQRAREIQRSTAARFHAAFGQGLAVIGFERSPTEGVYLLGEFTAPLSAEPSLRERIGPIEAKALRNLRRGGPEPAA
jgi:predicted GNAT superfamily acetyltransferase